MMAAGLKSSHFHTPTVALSASMSKDCGIRASARRLLYAHRLKMLFNPRGLLLQLIADLIALKEIELLILVSFRGLWSLKPKHQSTSSTVPNTALPPAR